MPRHVMGETMSQEELEELKAERLAAMRRWSRPEAVVVAPPRRALEVLQPARCAAAERLTAEEVTRNGVVPCPRKGWSEIARDRCLLNQRGGCRCELAGVVKAAGRVNRAELRADDERRAAMQLLPGRPLNPEGTRYPPWEIKCKHCGETFECDRRWGRKPEFCPDKPCRGEWKKALRRGEKPRPRGRPRSSAPVYAEAAL